MQIVIELPDDIGDRLRLKSASLSHRILELITADHYRQDHIGAAEVRRMLNLSSRWKHLSGCTVQARSPLEK
jgi:hypothetical protein